MKLSKIMDPSFHQAMIAINVQPISIEVAAALEKISALIDEQINSFQKKKVDLQKSLAEKNEDGTLKLDEEKNWIFTEENKKLLNEKISEMYNTEVVFPKINLSSLAGVKICVADYTQLKGDIIIE